MSMMMIFLIITKKMMMVLMNFARMMKSVVVESVPALAISFATASALVPWLLGCHREAILICILVASLQLKMVMRRGSIMNNH